MGIQVKLLGVNFNNPDLETIPAYGFDDQFERANSASLGTTPQGKVWDIQPAGSTQAIVSGQAYVTRSTGNPGPTYATTDAFTSNGAMEVKVSAVDINFTGMALRVESLTNYLRFVVSTSGYRLERVSAGATTVVFSALNVAPIFPVVLRAVMEGSTIELYANGSLLSTQTVPEHTGNTRHGIYSSGQTGARIDYATFTA